jgi:hypothetical protein
MSQVKIQDDNCESGIGSTKKKGANGILLRKKEQKR